MKIIAIGAQKGGVGKTTTAAAIGQGALMQGKSVLMIDLDSQGSLTHITGADGNRAGSYDLLMGAGAEALIQRIDHQPDIIPASLRLAGADVELSDTKKHSRKDRDFLLRNAIEPIKERYDLIIIDTPPALGTLLVNALTAATDVLIPLSADAFAVQLLFQLNETIRQVKQHCNPSLRIAGAVLTRHSLRTILSRDLQNTIAAKCKDMGIPLLKTAIREGIVVKEAQTLQENLFVYAPRSKPARDYEALIKELGV